MRRIAVWIFCFALTGVACRRGQQAAAPTPQPVSEILLEDDNLRPRLLRGVYPGKEGWRWTARTFAVSLDLPADAETYLEMDFSLPIELMNTAGEVTLSAKVNGVEIGRQSYPKVGRYVFASRVPPQALGRRPAEVEFALDKSATDPANGRELGVIAVSIGLKGLEQTTAFREGEMKKSHEAYENVLQQRNLKMPLDKQRELMKLFHELPVWESLWFQNVRMIKNPLDLWMMQQIIYEVRPDYIVETGTWLGGSALYWAYTLNAMGMENARVMTVDIGDFVEKAASGHPLWKKYVEFLHGSSTDPAIVSQIAQKVKNAKVLVVLDSDHTMHHVLKELQAYAPMVSPGSYVVVEDTHLDGIPTHPEQGPGPTAAVRRFLADGGNKQFEQDFKREALLMTFQPGGWLHRKATP